MLFRQLEYLVALSREKHFTRAAEACGVSQPALSEAIRKLEVELDLPLIIRGHKFEGLTVEGEQIVRRAERILADHASLLHEAASLRSGVTGTVRLGVVPTAAATAAQLTGPLCIRHPLVTVNLAEDLASNDITTRIDRFELDGGITYLDDDVTSRYRTFPLYREHYALLTADDPTLPRRIDMSWQEASTLPMCTLPSIMRGRRILDEYFADAGASHTAQIETDSIASLYAHVKTGQWAAVIPHVWLKVFGEPPGLRCTRLAGGREAPTIGLITRADGPASVLVQALEATAVGLDQTSSGSPIDW
ncbi:LysR family transcriptional regulator [Rhodococcus sp. (in: high G+C Gram-positive bacteria)]|uniref:LysR family transcriptional regulator n=1 Tax=Rhodococcus sp. TaxID=1831 RepID=UPI00257A8223|nr:LysR family transcriptional regulator [Rhodococcus sp. (in: high G+C Gram-positive bacteria)]MBQ9054981.1 LysR family transcriptional regulator [Rhodococcus sp. (in: high G+C Gram-positive bacteria)]